LALAGAAELDRLPDSETRAVNAINTLIANSTSFGAGSGRRSRSRASNFTATCRKRHQPDVDRHPGK